jgi:hypothetical protein
MKIEVIVEVCAETILMQKTLLLLLLLLLLKMSGRVNGAGIAACNFTTSTDHYNNI